MSSQNLQFKIMHTFILVLHVLSATVWTGGHLFLAIGILPKVLKTNNYNMLLDFERVYEKVGMPALVIQVLSGLYLAYHLVPDLSQWFSFSNHITTHIGIKLILLMVTVVLAVIANVRLIPNLQKGNNLKIMAGFAYTVTLMAVLFVIVGISFRLYIF